MKTVDVRLRRHTARLACMAATATWLSACGVKPDVITPAEHVQRAEQDYREIYAQYVPIDHPVSLADAVARALKYNYDATLSREQITLQERQLDVALSQMLPRLALNAGYNARNNDPAAQSINERTKQVSLDYAFSEEPTHVTAGPEFTWTVLDVGLSYFQAKQQGYQALIAVERRRKVIDDIVRRVQDSYWKAEAANHILPRLTPLLARAEHVLDQSRQATARQLAPDLPMLEFQRDMTQVVGQLHHINTDLNEARAQLATLINVPTSAPLALAPGNWSLPGVNEHVDTHRLEEIGLALRPELREEGYQERIDRQDVYKEIIKMMPGVGILANFNYDSNKYLFNNTWGAVGVQASFNLANIIKGPRAIAAAREAVEVGHIRRLALSVAVLSQVNLAWQQYVSALEDMRTAQSLWTIEKRISQVSNNAAQASSMTDAEQVRQELAATVSELNYYHAVAQVRYALLSLYISCGVDPVSPTVDISDLSKLTEEVRTNIGPWVSGQPPEVTLPAPAGKSGS